MTLRPIYIAGAVGLDTETSPDARAPNSLLDCQDAIIGRNGFLEARHGHRLVKELSELNYPAGFLNYHLSLLWYTYKGVEKALIADDIQLGSIPGRRIRAQEIADFNVTNPSITTNILKSATSSTPFNYLRELDRTPKTFVSRDRAYIMSNAGLYYKDASLPTGNWNRVENTPIVSFWRPLLDDFDPPENEKWLPLNYAINVKLIIEEESSIDEQQSRRYVVYESDVKRLAVTIPDILLAEPATVNRAFSVFSPKVQIDIDNTLPSRSPTVKYKRYLTVYRTVSYEYISSAAVNTLQINPPPLSFYPAAPEFEIPDGFSMQTFRLTINDDGITQFPILESSPSQLGIKGQYSPCPASGFVTQYKGSYVYANLRLPARYRGAFLSIPGFTESFTLGVSSFNPTDPLPPEFLVGGASFSVSFINAIFNSFIPPSSIFSAFDLTYRSTDSSVVRDIKIYNAVGASKGNRSRIQAYYQIGEELNAAKIPATFPTTISFASTAATGDSTKFPEGGGLVAITHYDDLRLIFSYTGRNNNTAGSITLTGCKAVTPYAPFSTSVPNGQGFLWYIPGNDVKSLPIYASAAEKVGVNLEPRSLSLLPNPAYFTPPVAQIAGEWGLSGSFLVAPVLFIGIMHKGYAQILDAAAVALVDRINALAKTVTPPIPGNPPVVRAVKLPETGEFEIYSTLPENEFLFFKSTNPNILVNNPSSPPTYPLAATSTAEPAGIIFPRQGFPEIVDEVQFRSPTKVGEHGSSIVGMGATSNDLIIFKEEGIFRADFVAGLNPTDTLSIVQIDASIRCQSAGSIQKMADNIIFLGQKGFMMITPSGIVPISTEIENEVKEVLSRARNQNVLPRIRSFSNEFKRIYGCFIPTNNPNTTTSVGVMFVYDAFTQNWTKWNLPTYAADVKPDGKLISLGLPKASNVGEEPIPVLRRDEYTTNLPFNPLDQYDLNIPTLNLWTLSNPNMILTITGTLWPTVEATGQAVVGFPGRIGAFYSSGYARMTLGGVSDLYSFNIISPPFNNDLIIQFVGNKLPPLNSTITNLYVGVPFSATFNSFNAGSPADLKRFTEYKVHLESGATFLTRAFRTDTQNNFTNTSTWENSNLTVTAYRALIPVEASRGRFIFRRVTHDKPLEKIAITGQTIVASSSGSHRTQRSKD